MSVATHMLRQTERHRPISADKWPIKGRNGAWFTRMNPDLAMDTADQKLLKSTGAGNLFMVFGESDLELRTLPDGKLQVELRGLDVYDPTTGEIRSDTADEIGEAAWSSLCSTVSRPFDPPSTGKIAVKVINHYGDEVLKVYEA